MEEKKMPASRDVVRLATIMSMGLGKKERTRSAVVDETVVGHRAIHTIELRQQDIVRVHTVPFDIIRHCAPILIDGPVPLLIFDPLAGRTMICEVKVHTGSYSLTTRTAALGKATR